MGKRDGKMGKEENAPINLALWPERICGPRITG